MKDWRSILIKPHASILEAIEVIDRVGVRAGLVVDDNMVLKGLVTDGDVRRGLLKRISPDESVTKIMQCEPMVASSVTPHHEIAPMMRAKSVIHMPIVDDGILVGFEVLEELTGVQHQDHAVLLMAGGLGSRLSPLTDNCPKPLLKIGGKPILQIIIDNFVEHGFREFYVSLNYKGEMIEDYFGDGSKLGVSITYLRENKRLGTAGPMNLLPSNLGKPFIVMNGDLLTTVDFQSLINFHGSHNAYATMCVREFDLQVPYGVVEIENSRILKIDEKPVQQFFVNAGIYVFDPKILSMIQKNTYFDMPQLFDLLLEKQLAAVSFPIREYWQDIGQMNDFNRAHADFAENFA